ncbi:glycine--tRNA ligase [Candidatus Bathyarchaeota archaeon]|nr:glycine--tRNA ligase [Candidatus Bathyarchaeota archaeon]
MGEAYEKVLEIASRRGFFWPSFEIYGGVGGFYTYGNLGTRLKRNIEELWREIFVRRHGFYEIEDPIINPSRVFEASGHLTHFREYVLECARCGRVGRADHLIEEQLGIPAQSIDGREIERLVGEGKVRCPNCDAELKAPATFLTMFQTKIGAKGEEVGYARPEAAQGMFLNFRRCIQQARGALPLGLAQVGKVLRNEIAPRRGLFRLREFTIMEVELFFDPQNPSCPWFDRVKEEEVAILTEEMQERGERKPVRITLGEASSKGLIKAEWQAYFMGVSKEFITMLGVPEERQRFRGHLPEERAHYSVQTFDHEIYLENWGWVEVAGHAYRTDYDLSAHQRHSGVDMTLLRSDGSRFIPHVVEPSFGLDRLVYVALETSFRTMEGRNILAFPRSISPINISVLPLVAKDGLPERAREVQRILMDAGLFVEYDERGSIGRRYARSDEAGTPLALTVDYQTLEDGTVTLRDRDSWRQVRQRIDALPPLICRYLKGEIGFSELGIPAGDVEG